MQVLLKLFYTIFFFALFSIHLSAQSGMLFSYGLATTSMQHTDGAHVGIQAGLDLIIEDYTFFILPGVDYYRMHLIPGEKGMIFSPESRTLDGVKVKLNFGKRIGDKFNDMQGRVFVGGNVVYANDISKQSKDQISIDDFQALHLSGNIGARFIYKFLTLSANYEIGLQDVYKTIEDSKANTLTISFGLFL